MLSYLTWVVIDHKSRLSKQNIVKTEWKSCWCNYYVAVL